MSRTRRRCTIEFHRYRSLVRPWGPAIVFRQGMVPRQWPPWAYGLPAKYTCLSDEQDWIDLAYDVHRDIYRNAGTTSRYRISTTRDFKHYDVKRARTREKKDTRARLRAFYAEAVS